MYVFIYIYYNKFLPNLLNDFRAVSARNCHLTHFLYSATSLSWDVTYKIFPFLSMNLVKA